MLLTSAALSLLLAACGGSSSSDEPATKALDASNALQTKAAVENSGVLGEVVATMLAQEFGRYTPAGREAQSPPYGFANALDSTDLFAAEPWTQSAAGGTSLSGQVDTPPLFARQTLSSWSTRDNVQHAYPMRIEYFSKADGFDFRPLNLILFNSVFGRASYLHGMQSMFADRSEGDELLRVGSLLRVIDSRVTGPANWIDLNATNGYSLRKGQRVSFNTTLQYWQGTNGDMAQLMLLQGNSADEARLCFNVHAAGLKRLACTQWRVPANWQAGTTLQYKGLTVTDDRSVLPGGSGHLHWQTSPALPQFDPLHSNGISGYLLAYLLKSQTVDYWSPRGAFMPSHRRMSEHQAAYPISGPMPDGTRTTTGWMEYADRMQSQQQLSGNQFQTWSWLPNSQSITALGTDLSLRFPTDGKTAVLLTTNATGRLSGNLPRRDQPVVPLRAPAAKAIGMNEIVPFNSTLHHWSNDAGNHIKLMLLQDPSRNDIRLCLDSHVHTVKRLVCSIWELVPDWLSRSELNYRGVYVVDDASGSLTFWQSGQ